MDSPWHSCIDSDLAECERLMMKTLQFENKELTEMCQYVIASGGKRLRPSLCILSYYACGGKDEKTPVSVGSAFEIVHSASLIHDDINDQGEIRRGRKTLHKKYTMTKAIIAGDVMFSMGFDLLKNVGPEVVGYIIEASAAMGSGEFVQKDYEHASGVTENHYMKIISGKTAKIFEACAKSGAFTGGGSSEEIHALGEYSFHLGLAFQIIDDMLDVSGDPEKTGKLIGTDLLEGKPTLPTIYAMQDPAYGKELQDIFEEPEASLESVRKALELIKKTDSLDRCYKKACEISSSAKKFIGDIPDSVYKTSLLNLADYVVSRKR